MRKVWLVALICTLCSVRSQAATAIDSVYHDSIRNIEYQLEGLSYRIINSPDLEERITSCYYFVQTLKKALLIPQSFEYEFTTLKTVSVLKPKDEKFRIFTWNLILDSGKYMYFGAIQMNRSDSLILYGLLDSSDYIKDVEFETVDHEHWVGALYYQIHDYRYRGNQYYMLFGWDGQDGNSTRKVIDMLYFKNGKPYFGEPVFSVEGEMLSRMVFEFADNAVMLCRYDKNEKKVVMANLVPPNPLFEGRKNTYLPDGTYSYLEFSKGYWVYKDLLFDDRRENSNLYRHQSPTSEKKKKKKQQRYER